MSTDIRHIGDQATMERAMKVRDIMNAALRNRKPQERDRMMQIHLAQARGPAVNAYLLRCGANFALRLRKSLSEP